MVIAALPFAAFALAGATPATSSMIPTEPLSARSVRRQGAFGNRAAPSH